MIQVKTLRRNLHRPAWPKKCKDIRELYIQRIAEWEAMSFERRLAIPKYSMNKAALELGISKASVVVAINLANALDKDPTLAELSEHQAYKKIRRTK